MVYKVDGGCRRNGYADAIGAAAAVEVFRSGASTTWTQHLPRGNYYNPNPTSQRAEITAIIMALELTLEKYEQLDTYPRLELKIFSDSRYSVGCMTEWSFNWQGNGWMDAKGEEVANRDLTEEAVELHEKVEELGTVEYAWIARGSNELADEGCRAALDEQDD